MTPQVRSEVLKLRTTATTGVLLLAAAGLTVLAVLLEGLPPADGELAGEQRQREMFSAVTSAVLFATFAGVLMVTNEFRYGTIRPTLLVEPRRRVVLDAKLRVALLAGALFGTVCAALAFGAGLLLLALRGVDASLSGTHALQLSLGAVVAGALSAALGVAVGTLVRNQTGALVAVVGYSVAVDAPLFAAVPSAGRWLPGKAGDALVGLPAGDLLPPLVGAAVLAAWTVALVVAAAQRLERLDA